MKQKVVYHIDHVPKTLIRKRPGIMIEPDYLTIHSTGNLRSTAANERAWLTNPDNDRAASWHICVDEQEAIQAIPLDEVAYHAGDKLGNTMSFSLEICESGDRKKTLDNAIEMTAWLLNRRRWGVDKLKRHYDWSGKICPRIFYDDNWAGWKLFVERVQEVMRHEDRD